MEETNKEEVNEIKENETKKVEKTKLSPSATVLLSIAAALGINVLVLIIFLIVQAI